MSKRVDGDTFLKKIGSFQYFVTISVNVSNHCNNICRYSLQAWHPFLSSHRKNIRVKLDMSVIRELPLIIGTF